MTNITDETEHAAVHQIKGSFFFFFFFFLAGHVHKVVIVARITRNIAFSFAHYIKKSE